MEKERWRKSQEVITGALAIAGKRAALAEQALVSEGHLSKLLSGELTTYCRILSVLGLEVVSSEYLKAVERIAAEHLPRFSLAPSEDK